MCKKILLILIVTTFFGCSKEAYKVLHNNEQKTVSIKFTNGKTSNLRIAVWSLTDVDTIYGLGYLAYDSNAVVYELDNRFYLIIAKQKEDSLMENNIIQQLDSLRATLTDSLRKVYPNDLKVKQINFFNDEITVFRKSIYWAIYAEEEYHLKDFIKPNQFYKVSCGNNPFKGNHVHNARSEHYSFEFMTNAKNEVVYWKQNKEITYKVRPSTL